MVWDWRFNDSNLYFHLFLYLKTEFLKMMCVMLRSSNASNIVQPDVATLICVKLQCFYTLLLRMWPQEKSPKHPIT